MANGGIRWEDESLFRRSGGAPARIDGMIATATEFWADRARSHMRSNAPWRDQTTNARNGLDAATEHIPYRQHSIVLFHGVPYGIWLEVRNGGRLAILMPTAIYIGPQLLDMIGRLWGPAVAGRGGGAE